MRRAGQRVRIVVHLVEPKHREAPLGRHLRPPAHRHLRGAERGGAADHRRALRWRCRPRRSSGSRRRRPSDVDAYNLYLLGRFHANKWAEADVLKGIEYFQGAIAKDPGYAVAYAGLADAYELLSIGFSSKPPVEYLALAKGMALKALEMDDSLAEAHTSLAYARWLGDLDWVRRRAGVQARARAQDQLRDGARVVRGIPGGAGPVRRGGRGDQARPSSSTRWPSR